MGLLVVRYVCSDRIPGVYFGYWETLLFDYGRGGAQSGEDGDFRSRVPKMSDGTRVVARRR